MRFSACGVARSSRHSCGSGSPHRALTAVTGHDHARVAGFAGRAGGASRDTRAADAGSPGHCRRRGSARTPRPPPRPAPAAARAPPNDRRAPPNTPELPTIFTSALLWHWNSIFDWAAFDVAARASNEFRNRVPVSYLNNENRNFCRGHENYSIRRGFPLLSSDNYFGNLLICHRFNDNDYW